jgi:hypothetical protein
MKLYEVPRNTRVVTENGDEVNFDHIDGMYSSAQMTAGMLCILRRGRK